VHRGRAEGAAPRIASLAAVTDPWTLARAKARAANVTFAPLTTVGDADRINDVIQRTWGGQHLDREVVRALALSGNVSWGAMDGDALVGFVLGWAGVDDDGLHVHSHMLAAVPDRRHRGVGEALKLAQRAQALEQGIEVVRWTFDPMVARNAWLNLGKLGAMVDRFERDFYGTMSDSINEGERSDRFTVVWDLRREPVSHRVEGDRVDVVTGGPDGNPVRSDLDPSAAAAIEVPREYLELRAADPERAGAWRDAAAAAAEACLAAGMLGATFDRERSAYVFAPPDLIGDPR
jgi:predicted GNAT superfamily acetyltransferase